MPGSTERVLGVPWRHCLNHPLATVTVALAVDLGRTREVLGELSQHGHQFIAAETVVASEQEQCLGLSHHNSPLGLSDHGNASSSPELQEPLVSQDAQGSQNGVRMDAEYRGHVLGRRQALTRTHVPGGNVAPDLGGNPIVQRA